jgi:hypothetical protein
MPPLIRLATNHSDGINIRHRILPMPVNIVHQSPPKLQASPNNAFWGGTPEAANQAVEKFFALIETILLSFIARPVPQGGCALLPVPSGVSGGSRVPVPIVVALVPTLFTSYSVYESLRPQASAELATLLALTVIIEPISIYLGHNAVSINGWGWLLAGLDVVGGWGIVGFGYSALSGLGLKGNTR